MAYTLSKKEKEQIKTATEKWRAVTDAYLDLREAHKVFSTAAEPVNADFAGPELAEAMARLFHRRNFSLFMEDLIYEDFRKGGISQLTPPKSSSGKKVKKPSYSSSPTEEKLKEAKE